MAYLTNRDICCQLAGAAKATIIDAGEHGDALALMDKVAFAAYPTINQKQGSANGWSWLTPDGVVVAASTPIRSMQRQSDHLSVTG